MIRKVFACLIREDLAAPGSLLVFTDHHGRMSVPKGTVEDGEHLHDAVLRELHEESGLEHVRIHGTLGERTVQVHGGPEMNGPLEAQHHVGFLIGPIDNLPERWSHTICSDGIDNGFVYHYEWRELTEELCETLAYGADWFIRELLSSRS